MPGRIRAIQDLIVTLADGVDAEREQRDLPRLLVEGAAAVFTADIAVLLDGAGSLALAAAEGAAAAELAETEVADGLGPSLDCFHKGAAVSCADLPSRASDWPRWSARAQAAGVTAVYAGPLRRRQQRIGVLTLLTRNASPRAAADLSTAQTLADAAAVGLLNQRLLRRHVLVSAQLQSALESRVLIEQAKGMLAERNGTDVDEAFRLMRRYARDRGRKIHQLAAEIISGTLRIPVDGDEPPHPPPWG